MLGRAAVVLDVLAHTHKIADRLIGRARHADGGQLARSMQTREVTGVDWVGLDAGTGSTRDHRGSDHVARDAERAEHAVGLVAGGAGLV
jgi:hypothetical protein